MILLGIFLWALFNNHPVVALLLAIRFCWCAEESHV